MSPKDLVSAGGVSAQQLAEIEARLKAATPEPWVVAMGSGNNQCTGIFHERPDGALEFVADCLPDWALDRMEGIDHVPTMEFITHAPSDVAALVEAVKALRGGLIRAHDALVTFERKALESPTDSITIAGALLKELRRGAAAVLGTPSEGT